jgi:DnaJ domain
MEDPFALLELHPGATPQQITASYRRLVKLYHPDLQTHGSQAAREEAERRMIEINHARHVLRSRSISASGARATLFSSHYLVFEPPGYRSRLVFMIKDEIGAVLGEVRVGGPKPKDNAYARELGPSYSIGPVGGAVLEVSRLLGRVIPMVKIEDLRTEGLIGHIARRGKDLWMEGLDPESAPAKLTRHRDHYVVELDGQDAGRVERSDSSIGQGFVVTVSPEVEAQLRMFLIAAPIAVKELG